MSYQHELVGGHLLLDLLNTVAWRLDDSRRVDRIEDPSTFATWLAAVGLEPPSAEVSGVLLATGAVASGASELLGRVVELREVAHGVLQPLAVGGEAAEGDVEALRKLMVDALGRAELVSVSPLRWRAGDLPDALVLAAWRLLEDEDLGRLRQCNDDSCGWLFLDRTKNGSRRWCSSADCGNRARAKRHYQRLHSTGGVG